MSDSPLDKVPAHNRVSIRAVLVHEGEDASAALAEAGFAETITVPVVLGEQPDLPGGILGNGITPNVTAVLETEQEGGAGASVVRQTDTRRAERGDVGRSGPVTTMLPPAFGMQPLAPVLGNRNSSGARDGRYDDGGVTDSATVGRFGWRDATGTDGERGADAPVVHDSVDGDSQHVVIANSVTPPGAASDPFNPSQEDVERSYYNERFWGMPVTQNQHRALQQGTTGGIAAGSAAGFIVGSMTEGAEIGSLGGPGGAAIGAAIGAVVGGSLGLIAGSYVGTQEDKAQGIPPLSPSERTR